MVADTADLEGVADQISELARSTHLTVATAESLTGGQISCLLGAAPKSAQWYRGSIVAYSSDVKHALLRVPEGSVVSEQSARAMAATTAELLGADLTVAVTGAGGPDPQDGQVPGTVWFGVCLRGTVHTEMLRFTGEPDEIVAATIGRALHLLRDALTPPLSPRMSRSDAGERDRRRL